VKSSLSFKDGSQAKETGLRGNDREREEVEAYEPQYVTPLISMKSGSPMLKRL
jgi:hypothetical protein